jgi:hexokinase
MQKVRQTVNEFMKKHGMDFEGIDLEQNCKKFIEAMDNGLAGRKSSLEMIPTYITMEDSIPLNEPVIVIDAGGTNFRVAVVHFDGESKPVVEDFKLYPMPGTQGEITKEELFETMASYLQPVLHKSSKIGFCFSYPVQILPSKDGKLLHFSKEVRVKGVEGELVGANLLEAVKKAGGDGDKSIVLLNDTVATLLGGKAAYPQRVFDSYIGFILGTGTNTCYIENNAGIGKLPELTGSEGSMLINVESGAYADAPRGTIDVAFDNTTVNPGKYMFEKMISGGYQGSLMLAVIKKAAEEGLFSAAFAGRLPILDTLASRDIDNFLYYPWSNKAVLALCCGVDESEESNRDRMVLYYLIDAIIERAARIVAINLAAVIEKSGKGRNPCAPVCIAAEGTTFYKSKLFNGKLDFYVKTWLNEQKGLYCEFVKADNATLVGTAIAGLMG